MPEVIVVGAGIVGLSSALYLAKQGWSITLIEANPHPKQSCPLATDHFDVKVVAINRASQRLFEQLDVWRVIQQTRVCAYQQMQVWDNVSDGLITFAAMDYFENDLGHIIEQQVILGALWQALKQQANVVIHCGEKVTDIEHIADGLQVQLQSGSVLSSQLLIAADGAKSSIRTLCQIDVKRWSYDQAAIVATVKGAKPHLATAYQRFAKDGPLALLPLADPHCFSIVWTTQPDNAQALCEKPLAEFDAILTRESTGILGQLKTLSERQLFPLHAQQARQYVSARCVLVGDAAHTLHPLAGQGVNLGLADVTCLMDILTKNHSKGRDIAAQAGLMAYQRRRQLHNQGMIIAMECFKRGFSSSNGLIRTLRNVGLNWVDRHKGLKQVFAKLAQGT